MFGFDALPEKICRFDYYVTQMNGIAGWDKWHDGRFEFHWRDGTVPPMERVGSRRLENNVEG